MRTDRESVEVPTRHEEVGGYAAGRMASRSGVKHGLLVPLLALVVTIVLAIIGGAVGASFGAAALAAAIAFGFGAQGVARDIVEKAYHRRNEVTSGASARSSSAGSTADDGLTTSRTEGGATLGEDEDGPSARPLRRDE